MKNIKYYNAYIFISMFIRNIIDVYGVVYLYKAGITIRNIMAIYGFVYFLGSIISSISLYLGNKIGYRYILLFSNIMSIFTYIYFSRIRSIYLIVVLLSLSIFTYHPIRHLYGIRLSKEKKDVGNILIVIYLASFISNLFIVNNVNKWIVIFISVIGLIPLFFIRNNRFEKINFRVIITKNKFNYFVFDQARVLFVLLEPIYLYIVFNTINYVGIFNLILIVVSIIYMYFISRIVNLNKRYKVMNLLFVLVLLFKLGIRNKWLLLGLSFFEGIGVKTNELVSTINLYNYENNLCGYLIISEIIFCLVRSIILGIFYVLNLDLIVCLYILIFGIFIIGFINKKEVDLNST